VSEREGEENVQILDDETFIICQLEKVDWVLGNMKLLRLSGKE
jgi:hypothetical protein